MKTVCLSVAFILLLGFSVLPRKNNGQLQIQFQHFLDAQILQLDSAVYQNALGQAYSISKFKYYVGHFRLKNTSGKTYQHSGYFLIDEEEPTSKIISLNNIPLGEYSEINFTLGVDSIHNCSGAQSSALDPLHGMFWSWSSGYIFLKLEGKSPACNTPSNFFEYHIGGYKAESNCLRHITLPFKSPLTISADKKPTLNIYTAVDEVLKNPTAIDFAKLPTVTDHQNATTVADNYADIFSIGSIVYEK